MSCFRKSERGAGSWPVAEPLRAGRGEVGRKVVGRREVGGTRQKVAGRRGVGGGWLGCEELMRHA